MFYKGFDNISSLFSMSTITHLQSCWNVAAYAYQMKLSLFLPFAGGFGKDLGYEDVFFLSAMLLAHSA